MFKVIRATKDTYISNKVFSGVPRTGANFGAAGSLNLFKLYGATYSGSTPNLELSRLLIKFDLSDLIDLHTNGKVDINHSSFKCTLKLYDVYGGQPTPTNFTLNVYPLSKSFDEGRGRDVSYHNDFDSCNFITASWASGSWLATGANLSGSNIIPCDYLTSHSSVNFLASQYFTDGSEDLEVDVTAAISASITSQIPNEGFRISFDESHEADNRTYFIKRFASRTVYDQSKAPTLVVKYDDSIVDDALNLCFGKTNTIFLWSSARNVEENLLSASSYITGSNSLLLRLMTPISGGAYNLYATGSQHQIGSNYVTGLYSASFYLDQSQVNLAQKLIESGSVEFTPIWTSLDQTVTFLTGSNIIAKKLTANMNKTFYNQLVFSAIGVNEQNNLNTSMTVRINIFDYANPYVKLVRTPIITPSVVLRDVHYSIRESTTNKIIVPFDTVYNSTRISSDAEGMYFNIDTNDLGVGTYIIDCMIVLGNYKKVYRDVSIPFRVQ